MLHRKSLHQILLQYPDIERLITDSLISMALAPLVRQESGALIHVQEYDDVSCPILYLEQSTVPYIYLVH
ncbi:hypothetical protein D9M71_749850 [compost metagenome]